MSILLFAGTSEGRALAQFLSVRGVATTVCVATEYGEMTMPPLPGITVRCGRMQEAEMYDAMRKHTLVIDATHPYADAVTRNIRTACEQSGAEYLRLVRPRIASEQPLVTVPDTAAAAAFLSGVTGSVLLTTGSKELEAFTAVERYAERLWPRVLPTASVLQKCEALGYPGAHIIAMQGPFSYEMNLALLHQTHAKYLVTKDTGAAGGFAEKLRAAADTGTTVVLISRPTEESGLTLTELCTLLEERFALSACEDRTVNKRFPLFVSLAGRKCMIFGAGRIAARRAAVLREAGASVTVIAPEACGVTPDILRGYEPSDLTGAFVVVAATDDRAVNARIAVDCEHAQILCSVADCAEESTFYFPALCQAGKLTAGVVSDGSDHAATAKAAARIRKILQEEGGATHENH